VATRESVWLRVLKIPPPVKGNFAQWAELPRLRMALGKKEEYEKQMYRGGETRNVFSLRMCRVSRKKNKRKGGKII